MELYSRIVDSYESLIGKDNRKTPADQEFEHAVLDDPSKTHVDITSNDVHRSAVNYNKGMNTQALMRSEVAHYLSWGALGIFGAALGAGAAGQLETFMGALGSASGIGLLATAIVLAGAAIYIKVNNAKIQSEKNMNLGEFEMRRGAKIMAQEIAKEMKQESPAPETASLSPATRNWVEHVHAQQMDTEIASSRLH